jgi:polar amino acid transport system substrate-binding protein
MMILQDKGISCALAICMFACGGLASEPEPPVIVVGDFANPPFSSWNETHEPVGIEVEILEMVGKALGRPIEWRELTFAEMLPAVEERTAHIAASTLGITEERARRVRFSESYHQTELSVVVRSGAGEPASLAKLNGLPVGAGRATTSEDAVRSSLPEATLVVERKENVTFGEMLLAGTLAAVVMDRPAANRLVNEHPGKMDILEDHLGVERYAFAVHPAEVEIVNAIDTVIRRLRNEGWFERLAAEHDGLE